MKTKVKVILVFLVVLLVGAVAVFYQFNRKVPGLSSVSADFSITANELFNEFDADEITSNAKYLDKVIEVTGTIQSVKSENGNTVVSLTADNAMIGGVNCSFNEELSDLDIGDKVRIKGRCQGFLMEVILNNCAINE